jgi:hypothetical protein
MENGPESNSGLFSAYILQTFGILNCWKGAFKDYNGRTNLGGLKFGENNKSCVSLDSLTTLFAF